MDLTWQTPSPAMWRARRLVVTAATAALALAAGLAVGLTVGTVGGAAVALGVVALGLAMAWLLWRRYRAWGYTERDEDLLVRRGVMIKRLTVVPYGRMQFVDVTAGPVDRIFGLSTVQLHTAAAATDARIPGLDAGEAERLRDQLAALGESKAAGL